MKTLEMKCVAMAIVASLLAIACSSSGDDNTGQLCAQHGGTCKVGPSSPSACAGPVNDSWCNDGETPAGGYCCLPCGSDAGTSDGGGCSAAN